MGDVTVHLTNGTVHVFSVREPSQAMENYERALKGRHPSFHVGTGAVFSTDQVTHVQLGKPTKSDFVLKYPASSGPHQGYGI